MPSTSLYFSDDLLALIDRARGHEARSSFVSRLVSAELAKTFFTGTGQFLVNVHSAQDCSGPCPIHNPSDHAMREWPLHWRQDRGIFERICPHGVGHPDPDSVRYAVEHGDTSAGVHGCDGCCS